MVEVSGKQVFIIAVMMIATYTFTGIIYPDTVDNNYSQVLTSWNLNPEIVPFFMDFPTWIQIQFMMGYEQIVNDMNVKDSPYYNKHTVKYVTWNYQEDNTIFDKFEQSNFDGAGLEWWNSNWVQGMGVIEFIFGFGTTRANAIKEYYNHYAKQVREILGEQEDEPTDTEKNLLELLFEFLGSIISGFVNFLKILSFTGIPNAPLWLVGVLNCIFIPLWILLVIGLSPYVAKLLEAGAKLLDALIPF